jgi:hypothetical protein
MRAFWRVLGWVAGLILLLNGGVLSLTRLQPESRMIWQEKQNGLTTLYSMNEAGQKQQRVAEGLSDTTFYEWAPDDLSMIVLYGAGWARINAYTGQVKPLFHQTNGWYAGISPDEEWVYYTYSANLYRENTQTGEVQPIYEGNDFERLQKRPPEDGWLVFTALSSEFYETDLFRVRPDGSQLERLTNEIGEKYVMGWTEDGEWMIYQAGEYTASQGNGLRYYKLKRIRWDQPGESEVMASSTYFIPEISWVDDWMILDMNSDFYALRFEEPIGRPRRLTRSDAADTLIGETDVDPGALSSFVVATWQDKDIQLYRVPFAGEESIPPELLSTQPIPYSLFVLGDWVYTMRWNALLSQPFLRVNVANGGQEALPWPETSQYITRTEDTIFLAAPELDAQGTPTAQGTLYRVSAKSSEVERLRSLNTDHFLGNAVPRMFLSWTPPTPTLAFHGFLILLAGATLLLLSGLSYRRLAKV